MTGGIRESKTELYKYAVLLATVFQSWASLAGLLLQPVYSACQTECGRRQSQPVSFPGSRQCDLSRT